MNTTTQPETAIVTVEKIMDWAISSQAPHASARKVQRLGSDPVGFKRSRSAEHLHIAGEDIARPTSKDVECVWKRDARNTRAGIPATNMGMDIRETLEGLIKRPVV